MSVEEKIRAYITDKKIQLATLAKRADITEDILKDIIEGHRTADCIEYHNICKALRVPLKTFME